VPLPGGDRVATVTSEGKIRVITVATGALEHELDGQKVDKIGRALTAVGGDIVVARITGRNFAAWNAANGERPGEVAAASGVVAFAASMAGGLLQVRSAATSCSANITVGAV
jgi:hypothetical protein